MKNLFVYSLFIIAIIIGCSSEDKEPDNALPESNRKIEVVDHIAGGGYTFLKGMENGKEFWVAIREMPVKNGDVFYFNESIEMKNFESKSLNKTFESILFVNTISKVPFEVGNPAQGSGMVSGTEGHTKPKVEASTDVKVAPLSDGLTVEAVNRDKASLSGKTVRVKGKVTKYNGGIMNRNWIHIQDGTGHGENVDITVTSDQVCKVGDVVVIEGTVTVDKDFGAGYFYDVIIEKATVTVENEI